MIFGIPPSGGASRHKTFSYADISGSGLLKKMASLTKLCSSLILKPRDSKFCDQVALISMKLYFADISESCPLEKTTPSAKLFSMSRTIIRLFHFSVA